MRVALGVFSFFVALAGLGEREAAKAQLKIVQTSGNERLVQAAMGLANELE